MASVGCLGSLGLGSRYLKPGKTGYFGIFECEIELDKVTAKPFDVINGKVVIETTIEIRCQGIRVQLDAIVNMRFETKTDNRTSTHQKMEGLLQGASPPGDGYYILSPVRQQLSGIEDGPSLPYVFRESVSCSAVSASMDSVTYPPGSYSLPFSLTMPGEQLPAPFKSQYGNLQYKIVAYMKSAFCYVQVAEKILRFRGYNNLSQRPSLLEIRQNESSFQKSIFSSKKVITAVLCITKSGFLPGEELPFKFTISNPKSFTVRSVVLELTRRVTYNVNGAVKKSMATLDLFETNEISKNEEIITIGKVTVPKNCIPTYDLKQVYNVVHYIQYQVKVAEYPGPLKGQLDITIGTTKDAVDALINRRMSTLQIEDPFAPVRLERSDSFSSRLSNSSVKTTNSLPPPYSQLSSRAVSMLSLDTLPPHFDEVK